MQDEDGNSNAGVGEIIVAKHRNGGLENIRLRFIKEYARFDNVEGFDAEPDAAGSNNLTANASFDDQGVGSYTVQSKMNSFDEDVNDFDVSDGEDSPF